MLQKMHQEKYPDCQLLTMCSGEWINSAYDLGREPELATELNVEKLSVH